MKVIKIGYGYSDLRYTLSASLLRVLPIELGRPNDFIYAFALVSRSSRYFNHDPVAIECNVLISRLHFTADMAVLLNAVGQSVMREAHVDAV